MAKIQPLTGEELKTFTTGLLDGDVMDDEMFYPMLNMAKAIVEGRRDWRQLLTSSSTLFANPADTYTTLKALPDGFIMFDQYSPMTLSAVDNPDETIEPKPSQFSDRVKNKNKGPLFYIDLANDSFALILDITKQYLINIFYTEESDEITEETSWSFPARYHPLLAYMVSGMQKGGVDYDDIFARMAPENRAQAETLVGIMEMWDDKIQRQAGEY